MLISGAETVIRILKEQKADTVFGYPGGTVAALYDALYKNRDSVKHIRTAGEQGAAHCADGYARITGKPGVCIATSGPGATNLVTGIATSFADSTPVVYITANVPSYRIGTDSFQEVDITGITIPITKYNKMVKDGSELASELRKAFYIACSGRPGPVLIDIPQDVLEGKFEYTGPEDTCYEEKKAEIKGDIEAAADIISKSKRPLILAGGGVRIARASKELMTFAELTGSAVSCTMMALGEFPYSHRQYVGNAGSLASDSVKRAITECDLFIAVGSRFSSRTDLSEKILAGKKIIHIDTDRAEINKNVYTSAYVVGDAAEVLSELSLELKKINYSRAPETETWVDSLSAEKHQKSEPANATHTFNLENAVKILAKTEGFDVIATDVGLHQVTTASFYPFEKPGVFLTSGGLGTMGFGLGAAIGAASAGKKVLLVTGDGSFTMEMNELVTLKRMNFDVTVLIMNNGALGMVKSIQKKRFGRRYSETLLGKNDISFKKLAQSFGIRGVKVTNGEALSSELSKAAGTAGPMVIDCRIR